MFFVKNAVLTVVVGSLLYVSSTVAAQEVNSLRPGVYALSFALPSGGGALVGATKFLKRDRAVRVDFGYALTVPDKGDSSMGFTVVPAYIMYLTTGRVATFFKGAMNITKQQGVKLSKGTTIDLGGFFGIEYFFLPEFSVAGEVGAAINLRNEFKDISSQAGTGALFGNFYF